MLQPQRRAEVHHVKHEFKAQPIALLDAFVRERPVKVAAPGFDQVPGKGVAQGLDANFVAQLGQIISPEAVVLSPVELIDVQVRDERAFNARAPKKLLNGE